MKKISLTVAILLLAGVVVWLLSRPESAPQEMPEMIRFDKHSVDLISLAGGEVEEIQLHRSENIWLMKGGERADIDAVEHLLGDLAGMEIVRVVTRNPDHYKRLGIGDGSVRVTLSVSGIELLHVEIGRQGKDLLSTYLRIGDSPEILAVNKSLLWQVRRARDSWQTVEPQSAKKELPDNRTSNE